MSTEEKSGLEDQLRSLLRREQPAPGFTDRVMLRVKIATTEPSLRRRRGWRECLQSASVSVGLRWVAAAACLLVVLGVIKYRAYRQASKQGEIAGQQALLALRIASAKLNVALKQVAEIEKRSPQGGNRSKRAGRTEHL